MRSLHQTGWITFRMRAMVVSFASYDLWLDWRKINPLLAQLFTDYEPGIHFSQLQMQSGVTGINAVRIYNPVKQSYDHDPEGEFIRRYLPELANLPNEYIHEPWELPASLQQELGFQPGKTYPERIVIHEEAIKLARSRMTVVRRSDSFKEQAQKVFDTPHR